MTLAISIFQRARNIPLATRLPIYVTVAAVLSLGGVTFFGLSVAHKTAEQQVISELDSLRGEQVSSIAHELEEARELIEALASYEWTRAFFENDAVRGVHDHSDFETIFQSYDLQNIYLSDVKGNLFYVHTDHDAEQVGQTAESVNPELARAIETSLSERASSGGFGFGIVNDNSAENDGIASGAFFAQAVVGNAGEKIGSLVLQISSHDFAEVLEKLGSMKNDASAFILDASGEIVLAAEDSDRTENLAMINRIGAQRFLEGPETGRFVFELKSDFPLLVTYGRFDIVGNVYTSVVVADYYASLAFMGDLQVLMLVGAAVSSIFVGVVSVLIIRLNLSDTKVMNAKLRSIAESRDFTRRIESDRNDEIGQSKQAINQILDAVEETLRDIKASADKTDVMSAQLADSAGASAASAETQAVAIEELGASIEQTESQARISADYSKETAQVVSEVMESAKNGNQVVNELASAMDGINTSFEEITKVIKVIDEIAFQTNLLALNAAVEAARAGQQGRGFAVVAQEVRNLAGRSSKAVEETSKLIDRSAQRVKSGQEVSTRTKAAFEGINQQISGATEFLNNIRANSFEQAESIRHIGRAMAEISAETREGTMRAESLSVIASDMRDAADQVRQKIVALGVTTDAEPAEVVPDDNPPTLPFAELDKVAFTPRKRLVDEPKEVEAEVKPTPQPQPSKSENVIRFNAREAEKRKLDPVDIDHRGIPGF